MEAAVGSLVESVQGAMEGVESVEIPSGHALKEEAASAVRKGKGKAREVVEAVEELVEPTPAPSKKAAGPALTLEERQQKLKDLRVKMVRRIRTHRTAASSPRPLKLTPSALPFRPMPRLPLIERVLRREPQGPDF